MGYTNNSEIPIENNIIYWCTQHTNSQTAYTIKWILLQKFRKKRGIHQTFSFPKTFIGRLSILSVFIMPSFAKNFRHCKICQFFIVHAHFETVQANQLSAFFVERSSWIELGQAENFRYISTSTPLPMTYFDFCKVLFLSEPCS